MLIFLHIGRTGGYCLRAIIKRGLPSYIRNKDLYISVPSNDPNKAISNWIKKKGKPPIICYAHYVGYGIHKSIKSEYTYITMLREPVARAVSILSSERSSGVDGSKVNVDTVLWGDIPKSFEEGLIFKIQRARTDNVITRTLGCQDGEIKFGDDKPCTEETFNRALVNIKKNINLVLLNERFDESVILLKSLYNMNRPYYFKINRKTKKSSLSVFTNEQIEFIKERDKFDIKLYKAAENILQVKLNETFKDPLFELKKYRKKNNFYGSILYFLDHISPRPFFGEKQLLSLKYRQYKARKILSSK